jgi:L-ornithine N5-oxygenase
MHAERPVLDVIGIGFGPANIALAIAMEESGFKSSVLFLEARPSMTWQPGMLFGGSDIQNHPLRDLVTPRNPRSRYSFTNFLFEHDRLFEHLNMGLMFPMRLEYAQYVRWAASHFADDVLYGRAVTDLRMAHHPARGLVHEVRCANGEIFLASCVVVAPGRTPYMPPVLESLRSPAVVHLTGYMDALRQLRERSADGAGLRVAVVGGSQSAVEILLHLGDELPQAQLVGLSRRFGYRLKDTSPFTGEVYFPQFVDSFFAATPQRKSQLRGDLHLTNYAAADADVLDRLYQRIYMQRLLGDQRVSVWRSSEIVDARMNGERVVLDTHQHECASPFSSTQFDLVVAATGFRDIGPGDEQECLPPLLTGLRDTLALDAQGCVVIGHDYSVARVPEPAMPPLIANGLCESSHGMGDAGSFSLLALRAQTIVDNLRRHTGGVAQPAAASPSFPVPAALAVL